MKRLLSILAIIVALGIPSAALVSCTTGCKSVQSIQGTAGYTPATGEITAGVTIVFKSLPPAVVSNALAASGATGAGLTWAYDTVNTDARRAALTLALAHGAELPGSGKAKR